jgi:hypothetical protein
VISQFPYPADQARYKRNLGYHYIRVGTLPDARFLKFIGKNLPTIAQGARSRFEAYKDLLLTSFLVTHRTANSLLAFAVKTAGATRITIGTTAVTQLIGNSGKLDGAPFFAPYPQPGAFY